MNIKKILFAFSITFTTAFKAQNPLFIPDTLSGKNFNLTIYDTSNVFYPAYETKTYGVNCAYLGPTLFLKQGDSVSIKVNNKLTDTTTIHWHGLHVGAKNDGGPHTVIVPNTIWTPKFIVRDLAGTYWYHPHLHMKTNIHATKGAAGLIIVRDSIESTLNLPRTYAIDDFPLVIQSKAFDINKQITVGNPFDSVMMINGTLKPFLQIPSQVVRLRLLNASSDRVYNLGFTGNLSFYQIASDGGLLKNPVVLTRLRMGPGERAEVLLNLTGMQGQIIDLISFASELPNGFYGSANPSATGMGTITGYSTNILNGSNFKILNLIIAAQTTKPITTITSTLTNLASINTSTATKTRTLTFNPKTMGMQQMLNGPFVINNLGFDMNVINYNININETEIWELNNQTSIAHPFHIHDVQFYAFDINGSAPPANMAGRKDVILVPAQQTVKFITKFENYCDTTPYMYHCHMLKHEDDGMMGQFVVKCLPTGESTIENEKNTIVVFPNPATEQLQINYGGFNQLQSNVNLIVADGIGKVIYQTSIINQINVIDIAQWSKGVYVLRIVDGENSISKKIIIQ